jgi:hypothetical protein
MTRFVPAACRGFAFLIAINGIFCSTAHASVVCPTNPDGSCIPVPAVSDTLAVLSSLVPPPFMAATPYTLVSLTETDEANSIATGIDLIAPVGPSGVYSSAILQLNEPGTSIRSDTVFIASLPLEPRFTVILNSDPVSLLGSPTVFLDETGNWQDISGVFDLSAGSIFVVSDLDTPLPAALPLFATGLGGLCLLGWRRKRKGQAVA